MLLSLHRPYFRSCINWRERYESPAAVPKKNRKKADNISLFQGIICILSLGSAGTQWGPEVNAEIWQTEMTPPDDCKKVRKCFYSDRFHNLQASNAMRVVPSFSNSTQRSSLSLDGRDTSLKALSVLLPDNLLGSAPRLKSKCRYTPRFRRIKSSSTVSSSCSTYGSTNSWQVGSK